MSVKCKTLYFSHHFSLYKFPKANIFSYFAIQILSSDLSLTLNTWLFVFHALCYNTKFLTVYLFSDKLIHNNALLHSGRLLPVLIKRYCGASPFSFPAASIPYIISDTSKAVPLSVNWTVPLYFSTTLRTLAIPYPWVYVSFFWNCLMECCIKYCYIWFSTKFFLASTNTL